MNRIIAAPRERVFEAWTTPEDIKVWFGPETCSVLAAQIDLRVNGEFCFDMASQECGNVRLRGNYREITPPSKLVYTWHWEGNATLGLENSLVTVEFIEFGGSTEIRLTHENLPSEQVSEDHRHGWSGSFDKLEKHLADADPSAEGATR
jgi:uncharacterized protein YndB with AHSA1/START domain